jgi:hypothetical protein
MYESKKMRNLVESVKKVLNGESIAEARSGGDSLDTVVTPRLEKANSLSQVEVARQEETNPR